MMTGNSNAWRPALAACMILTAPLAAGAAQSTDPDWPCIQRQVPAISPGMVWTGPSIEELERDWHDVEAVAALVRRLVARRTTIEEAKQLIGDFAQELGPDRNQRLTLVAAGTLDRINAERGEIIEGIKRYSRRQQALADRIAERGDRIAELAQQSGEEARKERRALEEEQVWDTRIFQEREQSLTYVCETPVLLEQRMFQIARALSSHLE